MRQVRGAALPGKSVGAALEALTISRRRKSQFLKITSGLYWRPPFAAIGVEGNWSSFSGSISLVVSRAAMKPYMSSYFKNLQTVVAFHMRVLLAWYHTVQRLWHEHFWVHINPPFILFYFVFLRGLLSHVEVIWVYMCKRCRTNSSPWVLTFKR